MTDSNVPAVWLPKPFKGVDLLPAIGGQSAELEPFRDEEVVSRKNVELGDIIVPRIKVLQGISDEVVKDGLRPGLFYLTNRKECLEPPIRGMIIFHSKSRALFPQDSRPETAGLERCIAPQAIQGSQYGDCATCQHKEWPKDENGKTPPGQSPPCSLSNNYVFLTQFGPYVLRFSRTSFKAGADFLSDVAMADRNFWHHPVVVNVALDTKELKGGSGKKASYFKMTIGWDRSEVFPQPYRDAAKALYQKLADAWDANRLDVGQQDENLQREE